MAAGTWTVYGPAKEAVYEGDIDLDGHVFKALLLKATYTPDTTNHDQLSDITAHELATTNGYGRITVSHATLRTAAVVKFYATSPLIWTADGGALADIKYVVIYDDTHADDRPLCYLDLNSGGGDIADVADGTALRVLVPAAGFFHT